MAQSAEFGSFFRTTRKALGLNLREFCRQNGFDPGNVSKLERGLLAPPQAREGLETYANSLKLKRATVAWERFFELAAAGTGRIPQEFLDDQAAAKRLPRLLRNLRPHGRGTRNWVKALHLEAWAESLEARSTLPQLVRRLVYATAKGLTRSEFPAGEQVQRPGWDGITEADEIDVFVPAGTAGWELGVDKNPQEKAEQDFAKRKKETLGLDQKKTTFISVTPRKWQRKEAWRQAKSKLKFWKDVRAYDSENLEEWLERAPAVDAWFAGVLGIKPVGVTVLDEYWANLKELTESTLKPQVFLVSRDAERKQLDAWLGGPAKALVIEARSPVEAIDFVVAHAQDSPLREAISARTLIVENRDSWKALAAMSEPGLNLIAHPALSVEPELVADACRRGHRVIRFSQPGDREHEDTLKLRRAFRYDLEKALEASGLPAERAQKLARESGGSLTVLKRLMVNYPGANKPEWAQPLNALELVPMLLAGGWDETNDADRRAMEILSGHPYSQFARLAERWLKAQDPPLTRVGSRWGLLSREDSWYLLGPVVPSEQLRAFHAIALEVLSQDDPSFELPPEERWTGSLRVNSHRYSSALRHGLAETLALLGAKPKQLAKPSEGTATAEVVVTKLLSNRGRFRWASLSPVLGLLAEASPGRFLTALEEDLRRKTPAVYQLFERDGGLLSSMSPHVGLLWALETLAWDKNQLSRVSIILAQLDENALEGRSGNRPLQSLLEIFLPWYPQTSASAAVRIQVLRKLVRHNPQSAWKLLVQLLPHQQQIAPPTSRPTWQDWAQSWTPGATHGEYWQQIVACGEMILALADHDLSRLVTLIEQFEHLPLQTQEAFLPKLTAFAESGLDEDQKRRISETIRHKIVWHNKFATASWALPEARLAELERVRLVFEPADSVHKNAWLFKPYWEISEKLDGEDLQLEQKRQSALKTVLAEKGWSGVIDLLSAVDSPMELGGTIAATDSEDIKSQVLPGLLEATDDKFAQFVYGYILTRLRDGWSWAQDLDTSNWPSNAVVKFLLHLPFDRMTWQLASAKGEFIEQSYWEQVEPLFCRTESAQDTEYALRNLIDNGKPEYALNLVRHALHANQEIQLVLLFETLEAWARIVPSEGTARLLPNAKYDIHRVFQHLQSRLDAGDRGVDATRLSRLEWSLLELLDGHPASPATLTALLRDDPKAFVDVLSLIFRRRKGPGEEEIAFTEQDRLRARTAYHLLMNWKEVPGKTAEGTVDVKALSQWITQARLLAAEQGLEEIGDSQIGEVLAHAPAETDGSWPCVAVRDALDELGTEEMLRGFKTGIYNKRGVFSRALGEGGGQERLLSEKYRHFADAIHVDCPRTAACLRDMSDKYAEEANRVDAEIMLD